MKVTHPGAPAELPVPGLAVRWLVLLRPRSLPKVLLPVGLGVALAVSRGGFPGFGVLGRVTVAGLLIQGVTLLLNDLGDSDADRHHLRLAPETLGPRVIPLGWLGARAVTVAALGMGLAFLLLGAWQQAHGGSPGLVLLSLAVLVLPLLYSLPPVRLNYRGGGELLETLGTGLLLPWLGWAYCGLPLDGFPAHWWLLALALAGSSALGSGLGHCAVDRLTGKNTLAVRSGPRTAAGVALALLALAIGLLSGFVLAEPEIRGVFLLACIAVPAWAIGSFLPLAITLRSMPQKAHEPFGEGQPGRFKRGQKSLLMLLWLGALSILVAQHLAGLTHPGEFATLFVLP